MVARVLGQGLLLTHCHCLGSRTCGFKSGTESPGSLSQQRLVCLPVRGQSPHVPLIISLALPGPAPAQCTGTVVSKAPLIIDSIPSQMVSPGLLVPARSCPMSPEVPLLGLCACQGRLALPKHQSPLPISAPHSRSPAAGLGPQLSWSLGFSSWDTARTSAFCRGGQARGNRSCVSPEEPLPRV